MYNREILEESQKNCRSDLNERIKVNPKSHRYEYLAPFYLCVLNITTLLGVYTKWTAAISTII